jgi:RNA polymerase sigma-70 factor, ECF subfamily
MSNKELLQKYVEENHEKFSNFVKSRVSKDESEDLVQTVYYRMLKNNSTVDNEYSHDGYLKMAARRLSYNLFKKKSKTDSATDLKFEMTSVHCNKSRDTTDMAEMAGVALSCLAEPCLSTVRMYYLEGKSIKEISKSTNTPQGTIKRRMHDARERMKEFMEANGYDSSDIFV